jgi:hypothetical protein
MHRLLDQSIQDRGNSQGPRAAAGLREIHPTHRLGPLTTGQQVLLDGRPMLDQIALEIIDGHAVDAARSPVRDDALAVRLTVPVTRVRGGLPPPSR